MCCLEESDESTTEPSQETTHRSYHSQRSEDSCSQSLATGGPYSEKGDDQSRALLSAVHVGDESEQESNDENDESEMASAASLFGSVVRTSRSTEIHRRATRRRMNVSGGQGRSRRGESGNTSDRSRDLLDDSTDNEEEEMEALDVSTRRQDTFGNTDRGNTSSPELVYGKQY